MISTSASGLNDSVKDMTIELFDSHSFMVVVDRDCTRISYNGRHSFTSLLASADILPSSHNEQLADPQVSLNVPAAHAVQSVSFGLTVKPALQTHSDIESLPHHGPEFAGHAVHDGSPVLISA